MTTIAIMQPYFFPYVGYWQLVHAVDKFIVYDDVNYIKGGWINRNRILISGRAAFMTAPIQGASSHKRINELNFSTERNWVQRVIKTIRLSYSQAPYFHETLDLVEQIFKSEELNLAIFLLHHLNLITKKLEIKTQIFNSTNRYENQHLMGQDRVIDICRQEGATTYVNAIGGISLYNSSAFHDAGIRLLFLQSRPIRYMQRAPDFIPNLSILDTLMALGFEGMGRQLGAFDLVTGPQDA